jgi:hypothetical protein
MNPETAWALDEITRELDLVVFQLEQRGADDLEGARRERSSTRRQLERLRDRLQDLTRKG